jgi:hypothetical protein
MNAADVIALVALAILFPFQGLDVLAETPCPQGAFDGGAATTMARPSFKRKSTKCCVNVKHVNVITFRQYDWLEDFSDSMFANTVELSKH